MTPKFFWELVKRQEVTVEEDLRMVVVLMRRRAEERDLGFFGGYEELEILGPFGNEPKIRVESFLDILDRPRGVDGEVVGERRMFSVDKQEVPDVEVEESRR